VIVYHDQHNLQEINNLIQVENLHIQINGVNHNIGLNFFIYFEFKTKKIFFSYHEYRLNRKQKKLVFKNFVS